MTQHLWDDDSDGQLCNGPPKPGDIFAGHILLTDCTACLDAAQADFEESLRLVKERRRQLGNLARPKDWNACPYESHANDCTCRGAGGDR